MKTVSDLEPLREARVSKLRAALELRSTEPTRTRTHRWTAEEIAALRDAWPDKVVAQLRTGRSAHACAQKAQELGLRSKQNAWRPQDKIWLRHNWTRVDRAALFQRFPSRTYDQIAWKARQMGLPVRGLPPPVITGHPVVDAVRAHAYEKGLTLRQLDEQAGTGGYWQSHAPLEADIRTVTDPMIRTVRILGGYLCAVFHDEPASH